MNQPFTFQPTAEMIRAAQCVFVAMTHYEFVSEKVLGYQRAILTAGQWHIDPKWVELGQKDVVILDPDHTFVLSENDFATYKTQCEAARIEAKLSIKREGNCPRIEARTLLHEARVLLLQTMEPITRIPCDRLLGSSTDAIEQAVDLALKLLAPHVDTEETIASFAPCQGKDAGMETAQPVLRGSGC